jgi:glucose-6-phosphate-specific signal transduction histidine kinase
MSMIIYFSLYLALVTWVSLLPIKVTRKYNPPYYWRWTLLVMGTGPLLSILSIAGFVLSAPDGNGFDGFMMTGLFILLLIIPFQLLVPMTVYMFICSSLKERKASEFGPPDPRETR